MEEGKRWKGADGGERDGQKRGGGTDGGYEVERRETEGERRRTAACPESRAMIQPEEGV